MREFRITDAEWARFETWRKELEARVPIKRYPATGELYTFCFTPTSIGCVVVVEAWCGEKIDLTDYSGW